MSYVDVLNLSIGTTLWAKQLTAVSDQSAGTWSSDVDRMVSAISGVDGTLQ